MNDLRLRSAVFLTLILSWVADVHAGEILVKFKSEVSRDKITEINRELNGEIIELIQGIHVYRIRVESIQKALDDYNAQEHVEYAERDFQARLLGITPPDDTLYDQQWGLQKMQAEEAWEIERGLTRKVVIAVLDTGIDLTHPDLVNRLWTNPGEINSNGIDDDGNGYIDDYYGWNFDGDKADPDDDNGHGTHVAGIIGAEVNNSTGIAGVNWDASLMAVKVMGSDGSGTYSDIAKGIIYATDSGAEVINMSIGGASYSSTLKDAVEYAFEGGVCLVGAAGNGYDTDGDGVTDKFDQISYPAFYSKVIAVGATDSNDSKASFSCYGPQLTLVAPGVTIMSTIPDNKYESMDGTSMATPLVAGIASLILGLIPGATPLTVQQILTSTCDDIDTIGWDKYTGFGRVNMYRALQRASQPGPAANPPDVFNYPNPFNPVLGEQTNIAIPEEMLTGTIEVRIYSLAGDLVRVLDEFEEPSLATWDGRNEEGEVVASGLYFYRVSTETGWARGKITVLK